MTCTCKYKSLEKVNAFDKRHVICAITVLNIEVHTMYAEIMKIMEKRSANMEGKRKRQTLVNTECIQAAKQRLSELGKDNAGMVNKRAAVKSVKAQIKAARARGCGWAEIIETLSVAGIEISLRTLKTEIENGMEKAVKKESKNGTKKVKPAQPVVPPLQQGSSARFEVPKDRPDL